MVSDTTYEVLSSLAVKYIPRGRHRLLHVDSREAWIDLVQQMIKKGSLNFKMSLLTRCAVQWETVLYSKYSILN